MGTSYVKSTLGLTSAHDQHDHLRTLGHEHCPPKTLLAAENRRAAPANAGSIEMDLDR